MWEWIEKKGWVEDVGRCAWTSDKGISVAKKKERGTHCWALKFFILLLYEGVCPLLKHCSDVLFGQEGEE